MVSFRSASTAHQEFADLGKGDRVRACYQHCSLMYVTNQRMSNQSLRLRFGLGEDKTVLTSQVIGAAKEAGMIKAAESETTSTRYARYLPLGLSETLKSA
jgi:ATP-dependent DNA helicase RecG